MHKLMQRLAEPLRKRRADGLERVVKTHAPRPDILDFRNNDYLGLAQHPIVKQAAKEALDCYGCSSSASPLITGFGPAHETLLRCLLEWHGFAEGMIWNSGYAANQAALSVLPQKGDLVLADKLIHNSMISGILHSGARLQRYDHCSIDNLENLLEKHAQREGLVFVVTESVFSMDGDYPDLLAIAELKAKHGFFWMLDEAHALGWYGDKGAGLAEEKGVADQVDLLLGTLGKALGSQGAYTLFHDAILGQYFANYCGEFIYSTYLSPASAASAETAIGIVREMGAEREVARRMSSSFRLRLQSAGLDAGRGDSPIVPIMIGDSGRTMRVADEMLTAGYGVGAIRPPTVPASEGRLRLSLKAGIAQEQLDALAEMLTKVIADCG